MKTDMGQGILQYNLESENDKFLAALNGPKYSALLDDIFLYISSERHNGDDYVHYDDLELAIKDLMKKHDI